MVSICPRNNYRRSVSQYVSPKIAVDEEMVSSFENEPLSISALRDIRPLAWLPKHSLTRRTAKITREVQCSWNARLGPTATVVPAEKVLQLFNDLQIFPTNAQVNEMLQCAQKCAARTSAKYLTFAEFCIFATELKRSIHSRIHRRDYFIRLLQKDGFDKNKRAKKMSTNSFAEVFLGGSCNPTTWRQDKAIPVLKKCGVTFYNPQVSEWSPELIEQEHQAKQNAQILLYVIDTQTRNVVSLIETSYFLGTRRRIIIVVNLYENADKVIGSEKVTPEEFDDLNSSLSLLKQLIERRRVDVFSQVEDAVRYAVEVIKGKYKTIEETKNGHKLTKMKEAFESLDTEKCGLISSKDICKALRILTQKRSHSAELRKNILQKIDANNKTNNKNLKVNFEQFCKIVSELNLNSDTIYGNENFERRSNCVNFFRSLSTPDEKPTFTENDGIHAIDIYLGGDCHQNLNWRQNIAIPKIRNACLTFYNPENERDRNQKLSDTEFAAITNSNVKLFVITWDSRSLFSMILASYFIGVGANVILCIQLLPEECVIGTHKLSQLAIKDYNRGRHYLADIARRENVPIFECVSEAVQAAVDKCIR